MTHAQFRKYKTPKRPEKKSQALSWWRVCQQWLPIILIVLLIAAGVQLWKLAKSPSTLPFKHIKVTANYKHTSPLQLKQAITREVNAGFFALDVTKLKRELQQQLPWVKSVMVRRIWPSTLQITINEYQAIAVWNEQHLVTPSNIIFTPAQASFPPKLPQLFGPRDTFVVVMNEFRVIQQQLSALNMTVKKLSLTDRQAWHLELSNDVVVMLGKDAVNQRLARFIKAYPQIMADHPAVIQLVDLRYPNGFAVK
ncbi:MAG: FtsQ-type POTRA domain-containing protein [Coxiellaceae bacterium]|nr:FtsQ-type POTRA domain-containing protein [Coxiellaceae bacterium]